MDNNLTIHLSIASFLLDLKQIIKDTIYETMQAQHQIEPSPKQSILLTRQQTCKLLKISLPTLDARIKDGSIPCFRIGKKVLFDEVKVMESIARKRGKNG